MSKGADTKDSGRSIALGDPLAICTLPPDSLAERLAWIRREILPHAIATERIAGGVAFELTDADGLAAKLDRLVALERDCCSSVVFEHEASATPGRRRLEVRGLPPDFAGFGALPVTHVPRSRLGTRIAQAAGFGAVASLVVCCVLPIAAAAVVGAAVAAPLASLDNPWIIASAAVLSAAAAFAWSRRRSVAKHAA